MTTAKVTSKGQITIPREVRTALGIETGSRVEFVACGDGSYELVPATLSLKDMKGVVRARGPVSVEDMDGAVGAAMVERSHR